MVFETWTRYPAFFSYATCFRRRFFVLPLLSLQSIDEESLYIYGRGGTDGKMLNDSTPSQSNFFDYWTRVRTR